MSIESLSDYEREFAEELATITRLEPLLEIHEGDLIVGRALLAYLERCVDAGRPNDEKSMRIELAAFLAGWNSALNETENGK